MGTGAKTVSGHASPVAEPSRVHIDRRRDDPVDLAGNRKPVVASRWALPPVHRRRRSKCVALAFLIPPRDLGTVHGGLLGGARITRR
jgi:hypothetical protein